MHVTTISTTDAPIHWQATIVKENVYFLFSLPPPQKAGNALAVQFNVSHTQGKGVFCLSCLTYSKKSGLNIALLRKDGASTLFSF